MSSSAHSALASLTANYTDSEPDDDDVEQEDAIPSTTRDEEKKAAQEQGSPASESNSNSRDAQSVASSGGDVDSASGGSKANALGLVSYQDDLIDDDVVDDFDHNSDSTQDVENASNEAGNLVSNTAESTFDVVMEESSGKAEVTDLEDISQDKEVTEDNESGQSTLSKRIKLPPEAPGKCPAELQEKFTKLYERKIKRGLDMNAIIQSNKQFRNPSIYEKLIIRCNIDELGTNYPPQIYDPHIWDEFSYYDELAKAQKTEMEKREKERKERTKVEFVSGTVKKASSTSVPTPGSQAEEPKRKSKWDQKGVMPVFPTAVSAPTVQPVLVQPPFTANASGTKGTVINAFGSRPKKPKV